MQHARRWGAVYILLLLFAGSWAGQLLAMQQTIAQEGWTEFWSATFENWQSEWIQLIFQAILLLGAKHWLFQVDAEDLERIEAKIDDVRQGLGR
jgi:disulfide bond formation protein DsbB